MKATALRRTSYLLVGLALFGLLVVLGSTGRRAAAETPGMTDLAIAIDLNGDSINECDTIVATGTSSTCTVTGTGTFGVKGLVRSLAGMPDENLNSIKEFAGMNWRINYTTPLVRVNSGTGQVLAGACVPGTVSTSEASGATSLACANSASGFTGAVMKLDFSCSAAGSGTITMVAASDLTSQTWLHAEVSHGQTVSKDSNETLTINCVAAGVGGIAQLPNVSSATPLAAKESSSSISIALIAGLAALVAAGFGGGAFAVARRRRS